MARIQTTRSRLQGRFVETQSVKEYKTFIEITRASGFNGLVEGRSGIGKTWASKKLAGVPDDRLGTSHEDLISLPGIETLYLCTPVNNTPHFLDAILTRHYYRFMNETKSDQMCPVSMLLIDEADRLKHTSLEFLRDVHDKTGVPIVFIGMPGIQRRFMRYEQLFNRSMTMHAFGPLEVEDMTEIVVEKCSTLSLPLPKDDSALEEIVATIIRYTDGVFRNFSSLNVMLDTMALLVRKKGLATCITPDLIELAYTKTLQGNVTQS